jgi:hypothetical protein
MQVDGAAKATDLIHRRQSRPDLAADVATALEAGDITHPVLRGNPRTGRINPFHF